MAATKDTKPMDRLDACIELGELIKSNHFNNAFIAGAAIQEFNEALIEGETPKMALTLAKNIETQKDN